MSARDVMLAVALAAVIFLLAELIAWARRRNRGGADDCAEVGRQVRSLQAEVAALYGRLAELETKLGADDPLEQGNAHAAYDYAVQFARQGMVATEIASRCGISRDEAALIVAIHYKGTPF